MKSLHKPRNDRQPTFNDCWRALVARKRKADGAFVYGVRTTGIFCRPGCRSRRPRPENVLFFASATEATKAGFRPCKRCQPDEEAPGAELEARLTRACRLLQQPEKVRLDVVAKAAGFSPYHFHRVFRARFGVAPGEFHAAHRLNRFKKNLRAGASVAAALYEAGFSSPSRVYENASRKLGMSPRQYRNEGLGLTIDYAIERTPMGLVCLAATSRGVCALEFGKSTFELQRRLHAEFPRAFLRENPAVLVNYFVRLRQYLDQPHRGLSLPLDLHGTAFQCRIWRALQAIPAGETASYSQLARQLGAPRAARAVGAACAAHRLAIAVPCHRAVRADGQPGGYRWGLGRKKLLLAKEAQAKRPKCS